MHGSEVGLVIRAIDGDRRALAELWNQNRNWVSLVVLARLHRDAELHDVLQEIAMALVRGIENLREPELFQPWLRSVALNTVRAVGRSGARQVQRAYRHAIDDNALCAPHNDDAHREALREAMQHMTQLPPRYREVLLLRAGHERSVAQIAAMLNRPVRTIESRLRRARQMLRSRLIEHASGDSRSDASNSDAPSAIRSGVCK